MIKQTSEITEDVLPPSTTKITADLLAALEDAIEDLQQWADDAYEIGEPFVGTDRIIAKAKAAIALATT